MCIIPKVIADITLNYFFRIILNIDPEIKALIKDCWGKGIVHVAQVVPERIAYLEKYVEKRYKDDKPFGYEQMPTFSFGSLGMGLRYAIDNKNEIDKSNGIIDKYSKYDPLEKYVRGYRPATVEIPASDYYLNKIFPPSRVQEIKELRRSKVVEEMRKMGAKILLMYNKCPLLLRLVGMQKANKYGRCLVTTDVRI
ncbi:MAG: hypothetical protein LE169_04330 [Endomicrobium sp.]|nr:hypothetical protein [Endomicrobium sp.]